MDPILSSLLARNAYNVEFGERIAFSMWTMRFEVSVATGLNSCGRNGTLLNPAAMSRSHLSGKVGAALDPCAAIQVPFELADGQEREIIFRLGVRERHRRCQKPGQAFPRINRCARRAPSRYELLEAHPRRGTCGNS